MKSIKRYMGIKADSWSLRILLLCGLCFALSSTMRAQYVSVDNGFALWISQSVDTNAVRTSNGIDYEMDTTSNAILTLRTINTRLPVDLSAIRYFKNLDTLDENWGTGVNKFAGWPSTLRYINVHYMRIDTDLALPPGLTYLDCNSSTMITSATVIPSTLTYLDLSSNDVGAMPVLPAGLKYLICSDMHISDIGPIPPALIYLDCSRNYLDSLRVLPNTLTHLRCNEARLNNLPTLPASLIYVDCSNNAIGSLPALPSLDTLNCSFNYIGPSLPSLPSTLVYLNCRSNFLTSLPILPSSLKLLACSENYLTSLPALSNLTFLNCSLNPISLLPTLPSVLAYLDCGVTRIDHFPALPLSLRTLIYEVDTLLSPPVLPDSLQYLSYSYGGTPAPLVFPQTLTNLACARCSYSTLPVLPASLILLDCSYNNFTMLPTLPPHINILNCSFNQLLSIPALPDSMDQLDCSSNHALSCLPACKFGRSLVYDSTNIQCVPVALDYASVGLSPMGYLPICTSNFNPGGCDLVTSGQVWPGDADANSLVDNNDLLPIGLGYDTSGPARGTVSIVWQADSAGTWPQYFTSYSPAVNFNHTDCNGDGLINADDTLAIIQNFSLTHAKTNRSSPYRSGQPWLKAVLSADSLYAGDTLTVSFVLGDTATTAHNIYGLAFTYNFDPTVVDSSLTMMDFHSSWLGNTTDMISISKSLGASGQIKTGITRIDHTSRSGNGVIGIAKFKITTDNISGKDLAYFSNIGFISDTRAIDQSGTVILLNEGADTTTVGYTPTAIKEVSAEKISLYPNPAKDKVIVSADNMINDVSVRNVTGQEVYHKSDVNARSVDVNASMLESGLYFVQVKTNKANGTAKLSIVR